MEFATCVKWTNDFSKLRSYPGKLFYVLCADVRPETTMDGKLHARTFMTTLYWNGESKYSKKNIGWYDPGDNRQVNPKICRVLAFLDGPYFPEGIMPLLRESNEKNYGESGDKLYDMDAEKERHRIALAEERARNADPVRSAQFRKELLELFETVK